LTYTSEETVRKVLNASPLLNNLEVATKYNLGRGTVSAIRCGTKWRHVDPETPRLYEDRPAKARCNICVQWSKNIGEFGGCTLGIPESVEQRFAVCCAAFMLGEEKND
jgi:hypothetical protein